MVYERQLNLWAVDGICHQF